MDLARRLRPKRAPARHPPRPLGALNGRGRTGVAPGQGLARARQGGSLKAMIWDHLTHVGAVAHIYCATCSHYREVIPMTSATLAERLGGEKALSTGIHSDLDLADAVRSGIPYPAVEHVIEAGLLSANEMYELVGSRRSLTRKKTKKQPLSAVESDRLARVVRVISRAEEALGDAEAAYRWLRKPNRALGGRRPLDLLASDIGARMVEQSLGRIEHGVYS
ncbi:MAG: DUF2384 domain-containing protein [Gemmatimonadales bacterium]|nr:MAG: DUF2384 domain-containing protein [Gemmatimonadales bacterium]